MARTSARNQSELVLCDVSPEKNTEGQQQRPGKTRRDLGMVGRENHDAPRTKGDASTDSIALLSDMSLKKKGKVIVSDLEYEPCGDGARNRIRRIFRLNVDLAGEDLASAVRLEASFGNDGSGNPLNVRMFGVIARYREGIEENDVSLFLIVIR